jgi:hypothetical protein
LKKQAIIGVLLIVVVAVAAVLIYQNSLTSTPLIAADDGFTMVYLSDNSTLLSDSDILSFNGTSQEFNLTDAATQRLQAAGDNLYSFSNVVSIRVNGEEIYRGIFRSAVMSAVPELPTVAILYPSITFPGGAEKENAMRIFYPGFTVPSDMQAMNTKLTSFFEDTNRLTA